MKKIFIIITGLFIISLISCRNKAQRDYERYMEMTDTANMEYIIPKEDTVLLDENGRTEEVLDLGGDDDGIMVIPDIPQERAVSPTATDYELEKMMSGKN